MYGAAGIMYRMMEKTGAYIRLRYSTVSNNSTARSSKCRALAAYARPRSVRINVIAPMTPVYFVIRPVSVKYQKRTMFRADFAIR